MRNQVQQATDAAKTAAQTGANLGATAATEGTAARDFLTSEMLHPQGYGQQGVSAMNAAAQAGAGGAASGLTGGLIQRAAVSRNAGGSDAAVSDIARQRMKAAAGASEDIAAKDADLKNAQQQAGAEGLEGMYKTDTSGMLDSNGQVSQDVNAATNANNSGWLQNAQGLISSATGAAKLAGGFGIPGFSGFRGR